MGLCVHPASRSAIAWAGFIFIACSLVVPEAAIGGAPLPVMLPVLVLSVTGLASSALGHGLQVPKALLVVAGSFVALVSYAFMTVPVSEHVIGVTDSIPVSFVPVPIGWITAPLWQALLTCLAALLTIGLVRREDLGLVVRWATAAGVPLSVFGFAVWYVSPHVGERFATRLGGAAVIHVALLIGCAVAIGIAMEGYHRRLFTGVAAAYGLMIFTTQARAGIICLALLIGYTVVRSYLWVRREKREWLTSFLCAAGVAVLAAVWMVQTIFQRRGGRDTSGGGRTETWLVALAHWTSSLENFVVGSGYGTLWPWFGIEAGALPQSGYQGMKLTALGETLGHPHNVGVAIGGELGLVGLVLFAPVALAVLIGWAQATTAMQRMLGAALAISFVAFCFDTYLLKNFPVSFVWWCSTFALLRLVSTKRRSSQQAAHYQPEYAA